MRRGHILGFLAGLALGLAGTAAGATAVFWHHSYGPYHCLGNSVIASCNVRGHPDPYTAINRTGLWIDRPGYFSIHCQPWATSYTDCDMLDD